MNVGYKAALLCSLLLNVAPLMAVEPIAVRDAWMRATPPNMTVTAAYMVLENTQNQPVTLTGAITPVSARVEIHNVVHDKEMMQMVPQSALIIPQNATVTLKPGSYHFMLLEINKSLQVGEQIPMTLQFQGGQSIQLTVPVRKVQENGMQHMQHSPDHKQ